MFGRDDDARRRDGARQCAAQRRKLIGEVGHGRDHVLAGSWHGQLSLDASTCPASEQALVAHQAVDVPTQDVGSVNRRRLSALGVVDDHGIPAAILDEPADAASASRWSSPGTTMSSSTCNGRGRPAEEPPEVVRDDAPGALQLTSAVEVYAVHVRRHCHRVGAETGGEHVAERVSCVSRTPPACERLSGRRECGGRREGGFTNTTLAGHEDHPHPTARNLNPLDSACPGKFTTIRAESPWRSLAPLLWTDASTSARHLAELDGPGAFNPTPVEVRTRSLFRRRQHLACVGSTTDPRSNWAHRWERYACAGATHDKGAFK